MEPNGSIKVSDVVSTEVCRLIFSVQQSTLKRKNL